MTKFIIISYFFPPSNFVGGERTEAWAKHLHKSGVYPIIITRNWNENQKSITEKVSDNAYRIEKNEHYEIRRLPYKRTLRDKCSDYRVLKPIQKALTLWELITSNFSIKALPYSNFYTEAKKVLEEESDIVGVIASGRPFQSFAIGHKLKKEFPSIFWMPDYRDEWTTHNFLNEARGGAKYINKLERKSELKWTANADHFITVSQPWKESIYKIIKKEGTAILNGYTNFIDIPDRNSNPNQFTITYAGTLYHKQNIEPMINACKKLIDQKQNIFLRFIGIEFQQDAIERINQLLENYQNHFEVLDRMPKKVLTDYLNASDLLFLTSFEGIKGWFPVKLFEYYASGIPMILCPSDHESMESFIKSTNSGFIADTSLECERIIADCIELKKEHGFLQLERNKVEGHKYSRQFQTERLGKLILDLIN